MSYVIRGPRGWVAKLGHRSSYTIDLRHARKFKTKDMAEKERCSIDETVEDLERIIDKIRE